MGDLPLELVGDAEVATACCEDAETRTRRRDCERKSEDGTAEEPPRPAVPTALARRDVVRLAHVDRPVVGADDQARVVQAELALRGDSRSGDDRVPRRPLIVEHGDHEHVGHFSMSPARGVTSRHPVGVTPAHPTPRELQVSNPPGGDVSC